MQLDIKALGVELAAVVKSQLAPMQVKIKALESEVSELKKRLDEMPMPTNGKDGSDGAPGAAGKDCDMAAVKAMVDDFMKSVQLPKDGKDGADGKDGEPGADGKSVTVDDVLPALKEQADAFLKSIPMPKDGADGKDGRDGIDGKDGERGEKGADGLGMAGSMIDRDGNLLVTMTNGEVKNLGAVVGKDGRDGVDGLSLESFEMDYLEETHEVRFKAACGGRVKEVKFPAGGVRAAGYWREGTKAKAGEIYTHDGSGWVLLARKGRDGETIVKTVSNEPPKPIKLKKDDDK